MSSASEKLIEGKNSRHCNHCKKLKHFNQFYKKKNGKYGLRSKCKSCFNEYQKKYDFDSKKIIVKSVERNLESFRDKLFKSKFCTKCGEYKSWDDFHKNKRLKYGLTSKCKTCVKKYSSKHYSKYKKQILKNNLQWKKDNPNYMNEYVIKRKQTDKHFHILLNLKGKLSKVLNGAKSKSLSKLFGCSRTQFLDHIESQFTNKMTWDNYGNYWHVDHIIPCSAFDHTCEYQRSVCWHYSNLQPLEASKNQSKGNSIPNLGIKIDNKFLKKYGN